MRDIDLSEDLIVADVLDYWPETVPVFLNRRMGCVGCTMASFETLAEAANIYGLCCTRFVKELQDSINKRRIT